MTEMISWAQWSPLLGLLGLAGALVLYMYINRQSAGTDVMTELAARIHEGAMAFLRREYSVLAGFVLVVAVLLYFAIDRRLGGAPLTSIAYITGALSSVMAGFFGMTAATRANVRTAEAARTRGQAHALRIAFHGGAVMGLAVASLGLLGIGAVARVFLGFGLDAASWRAFSEIISGFAMGASSIALFARVGGGIYTKAADVGADLVGKVEAGIPEDDPRNPATIADNVGDNVGDVAGMGADIFESYVGAMVATIVIGAIEPALSANRAAAVAPIAMVATIEPT